MEKTFDLAIVGGGMVGACLARASAQLGLSCLLVEAAASQLLPGYDDRAIALAEGSRRILASFGIWPRLAAQAAAIRQVHVSDRGHYGSLRIRAEDQGVDALGQVVSGHALGQALFSGLENIPQIRLLNPAQLIEIQPGPKGVELILEYQGQRQHYQARLVAAADGARSRIRQQLAIPTTEWDYRQSAIIANLSPSVPPQGIAYERFATQGPMAMLPLVDGRYAMVWTLPQDQAEEALALADAPFLQRLQAQFGMRLGRLHSLGARTSYPLKLIRAHQQAAERVVLMGNAAHALHPITGQGFNLGLRDVACLADLLYDAQRQGADPGGAALGRAYSRARHADQQQLALVTDGLVRLFTNPLPPLALARDLGLVALNNSPSLKHLVARRFMGLSGRQPRPSRGLWVTSPPSP